jgi:hypothetical protein
MANHPIVGTWLLTDQDDPSSPPFQNSFFADGVVLQVDPSQGDSLGVWKPTIVHDAPTEDAFGRGESGPHLADQSRLVPAAGALMTETALDLLARLAAPS